MHGKFRPLEGADRGSFDRAFLLQTWPPHLPGCGGHFGYSILIGSGPPPPVVRTNAAFEGSVSRALLMSASNRSLPAFFRASKRSKRVLARSFRPGRHPNGDGTRYPWRLNHSRETSGNDEIWHATGYAKARTFDRSGSGRL